MIDCSVINLSNVNSKVRHGESLYIRLHCLAVTQIAIPRLRSFLKRSQYFDIM